MAGALMATRVTFMWEETPEITYDELIDRLMHLGAEDIDTEEVERQEPKYKSGPLKPKKVKSEGISLPTDGIM
jgi:hypothetical protein